MISIKLQNKDKVAFRKLPMAKLDEVLVEKLREELYTLSQKYASLDGVGDTQLEDHIVIHRRLAHVLDKQIPHMDGDACGLCYTYASKEADSYSIARFCSYCGQRLRV